MVKAYVYLIYFLFIRALAEISSTYKHNQTECDTYIYNVRVIVYRLYWIITLNSSLYGLP